MRAGEALGLRHEDIAAAERQVSIVPRANVNRARTRSGQQRAVPVSAELIRLHSDYCTPSTATWTATSVCGAEAVCERPEQFGAEPHQRRQGPGLVRHDALDSVTVSVDAAHAVD